LEDSSARIVSDISGIHDASANLYVKDKSTNNIGQLFSDKVYISDTAGNREATYFPAKIEYTDTIFGNKVTVRPGSYNNQTFIYPNVGGAFTMSVNGIFADLSGNISLPIPTPGGAAWGSITGTITNQTDLISYLSTGYLKLDQTIPQTVLNGVPNFSGGIIGYIKDNGATLAIDNINRQLRDSTGFGVKFDWELMKFPSFTSNGFVKTSAGDGTLTIDTALLNLFRLQKVILKSHSQRNRLWV